VLYLMSHQITLVADIITVVVRNGNWNLMTYSAEVPKTLENFSEVAVYFRLLQNLLQRQDQVFGNSEQTFCTFSLVCDSRGCNQRGASALDVARLHFMKAHTIEISPWRESLGRQREPALCFALT